MGSKAMLHLDRTDNRHVLMVEFKWVQALQKLTESGLVEWTLLVGRQYAAVSLSEPHTATGWAEFINKIKGFNKDAAAAQDQMQITKIVMPMTSLGKTVIRDAEAQMLFKEVPCTGSRVIYDWHLDKGSKGNQNQQDLYLQAKADVQGELDVELILSNFAFQDKDTLGNKVQQMLQTKVDTAVELGAMPGWAKGASTAIFITPINHMKMRLRAQSPAVAAWFCKEVVSLQVQMGEMKQHLGQISFMSQFHMMHQEELDRKLKVLCLTNQTHLPAAAAGGQQFQQQYQQQQQHQQQPAASAAAAGGQQYPQQYHPHQQHQQQPAASAAAGGQQYQQQYHPQQQHHQQPVAAAQQHSDGGQQLHQQQPAASAAAGGQQFQHQDQHQQQHHQQPAAAAQQHSDGGQQLPQQHQQHAQQHHHQMDQGLRRAMTASPAPDTSPSSDSSYQQVVHPQVVHY